MITESCVLFLQTSTLSGGELVGPHRIDATPLAEVTLRLTEDATLTRLAFKHLETWPAMQAGI